MAFIPRTKVIVLAIAALAAFTGSLSANAQTANATQPTLDKIKATGKAVLGVRDNGTEIAMALKAEPGSAAGSFRYYAEAIDKVYGEIAPTAGDVLDSLAMRARYRLCDLRSGCGSPRRPGAHRRARCGRRCRSAG